MPLFFTLSSLSTGSEIEFERVRLLDEPRIWVLGSSVFSPIDNHFKLPDGGVSDLLR